MFFVRKIFGKKLWIGLGRKISSKIRRRIWIGFCPYTYVRVTVMKTKLLKRSDYEKLLKMKFNEIAKYLGDSGYKQEIDELAVNYSSADLLEHALNKNIGQTYEKLRRISPDSMDKVINAYLRRRDYFNIKTIIRGKFTGEEDKKIERLLVPVGSLTKEFLLELIKKETVEEIVGALGIEELTRFFAEKEKESEEGKEQEQLSLFDIESILDKLYYGEMMDFSRRLTWQGKLFAQFLRNEIDIMNITTLLRLKQEGFEKEDIMKHLFYSNTKLNKKMLGNLIDLEEAGSIPKELGRHGYSKMAGAFKRFKPGEEISNLFEVEIELNKLLFKESLLLAKLNPLTVDVILGYIFAKEVEIKNLKAIVKGKQLGVNNALIEQGLVMGA